MHKALLPAGLHDALAPEAAFEAEMTARMMGVFAAHGYECVRPPLVEFEESLLAGPGGAVAGRMFRLMDPDTQRMMGVRPDITPQIARIATTRLANQPRPLRLSYAGPVLTVKGSELRPEREVTQVGVELIGSDALTADAEVISVTAEVLAAIGIAEASFDLTMPQLVPMVCAGLGLDAELTTQVRAELDRKDAGALVALPGVGPEQSATLGEMLRAAGPAAKTLAALGELQLPPAAAELVRDLGVVVGHVHRLAPGVRVTVDPVECRGAAYQTGISFTIFAKGATGELGRGGRYPLDGETATGATLFVSTLLRSAPPPPVREAVFLPFETPANAGDRLRAEGWCTVRGLTADGDAKAAALAAGCSHLLKNGKAERLA